MSTIGKEVSDYITKRLQTLQLSEEKSSDTLLELESAMDVYLTQKLKKCVNSADCCEKDCSTCPCSEKDLNVLQLVCSGDSCTLVPAVTEPVVEQEAVTEPKVEEKIDVPSGCPNPACKCSPCLCENCACVEAEKPVEIVEHKSEEQPVEQVVAEAIKEVVQEPQLVAEPVKEEAVQIQESQPVVESVAEPVKEETVQPVAEPVLSPVEQAPVEIPSIVEPAPETPPNVQEAAAPTA